MIRSSLTECPTGIDSQTELYAVISALYLPNVLNVLI